jgi:large subunit ribosomal protein L17
MIKNMLRSLFTYERIKTTIAKAKLVRRQAERLISITKENTVATQRLAFQYLQDRILVKKLVTDIAPRFDKHPGGYTRILKIGTRPGDSAEVVFLELVIKKVKTAETDRKTKPKKESEKK